MAKPVTKYAVQIRKDEDIVKELNKAYHIANSGRKGPVLIDLPIHFCSQTSQARFTQPHLFQAH